MSEEPQTERRLKFYGAGDYGTYFQLEQAHDLLRGFDSTRTDYGLNDIVELDQAIEFLEGGFLPRDISDEEAQQISAIVPAVRRAIGVFFGSIDDSNIAERITDVHYVYNGDVLRLLARNKAFDRCSGSVVLAALRIERIPTGDVLSCGELVRAYDAEAKALLISSPDNAELIISKELQADAQRNLRLPASFTSGDSRQLIDSYIDSESPNPNYLRLVADARVNPASGIDDRLKLKARRAYDAFWAEHFETNEGIRTGCEIRVSDDQADAARTELDGMFGHYSYSREWLAGNLDHPTILNNFVHLFEYANVHMLLHLPSYYSHLGVLERFMFTAGREDYRAGAAFNHTDQVSLLQLVMYDQFLQAEGVALETVIEWFFNEYIATEFGAEKFRFQPSSNGATYLEKSRHLFSEMESVLKQFRLYAEDGELDLELLSMTSQQLLYREIPSLITNKYVYVADHPDIQRVQNLLFSDQAGLGYVNEEFNASTFAELIQANDVPREVFHEFQRGDLDFLISHDIVECDGESDIVRIANLSAFRVLKCLNDYEAASYRHYSSDARHQIDRMLAAGWVTTESSLLTRAEASYFNYQLNKSEFTNGPDLRNRYLHGSQADGLDGHVHRTAYMHALRLIIALVIKINDDFDLVKSGEANSD